MTDFVRAKSHTVENLGIGKIIEIDGTVATVAWFDSPLTEPLLEEINTKNLSRVTLERQTRVYWLDRSADVWRVGRIIDADDQVAQVRFPNNHDRVLSVSELEVRWDRPISDPSAFLAAKISESPQFADARSQFARSLITQRGACYGMSGLISSIIDLELHQFEVVKRVLQDPVQRYLLADEVGLGKTIEAGVLVRQYVLDNPRDHAVLVIVPRALLVQWRRELRKRFLLGDFLDESLEVMAMDADPAELLRALSGAGMVVIDEAHHLSHNRELYRMLREAIIQAPRLLLLSATPVLHNEQGFMEMLHLLDPLGYRLEDQKKFRSRIENRQALAESVAGLIPENLLQIDDFLDDLTARFPNDEMLGRRATTLRNIVADFPEETDPDFLDALLKMRAHLTETYRLDRRILRNRRRDNPYLTPHRAGVERIDYSSAELAHVVQLVEGWRSAAAELVYGQELGDRAQELAIWFRALLEAVATNLDQIVTLVEERRQAHSGSSGEPNWETRLLDQIEAAVKRCGSDEQRLDCLRKSVKEQLEQKVKVVIFCSAQNVADRVAESLRSSLHVPVDRHESHPYPEEELIEQEWEKFLSDSSHQVLVCDAVAEEGLNLQGGQKVVIHYDLPLAPNRIEQRLGRVDRYGSGDAIPSLALCCSEDGYALAWFSYLSQGLKLFDRSVASLQYLIDDEMRLLNLRLLIDGAEAFDALSERTAGPDGDAERELRRIDDQDALDALTLPDEEDQFENLVDVDSDWRDISESVQQWIVDILHIDDEPAEKSRVKQRPDPFGFSEFRFCFTYREQGHSTLIPLTRVLSTLVQVIDTEAKGTHRGLLKTGWYTCRRATAIGASAPEGIRLVRLGDALIDRITEVTDLDDRGRSAAIWRQRPEYVSRSDQLADLFLRFDFIVEADLKSALLELEERTEPSLQSALRRRGDMLFAPFYKTIWLDETLSLVKDPDLVEELESPYRRSPNDGPYQDWNVNAERWDAVMASDVPALTVWRQWIPEARDTAEEFLRREAELESLCDAAIRRARAGDEGRFAQFRSRILHAEVVDSSAEMLASEQDISNALYQAIQNPKVSLGSVMAFFVSSSPLPQVIPRSE